MQAHLVGILRLSDCSLSCYFIGELKFPISMAAKAEGLVQFLVQVVILQDFKWYDFIFNLHKLYKGTHLSVKNVISRRFVLLYYPSFYFYFDTIFLIYHSRYFFKGQLSALTEKIVSSCSACSIEVEEIVRSDSIYVQSDGEYLGFLPRKFHILPGAIEMIC